MGKVTGIETSSRLQTFMGERNIKIDNKVYVTDKLIFGDPSILDIFDFDFLSGNPKEAYSNPFNLIISQKTAQKFFGNSDPLGKNHQL
jgi:putative ABC transport system permease protein